MCSKQRLPIPWMASWSLAGEWKEQGPGVSDREVDSTMVPLRQVMTWN